MDDELKVALADLAEAFRDGFARMDRHFVIRQVQYAAFRAELRGEMAEFRAEVERVLRDPRDSG